MQQLDTWFNSPRGHATVVAVLVVASQIWPQYAAVLNRAAVALGYGAIVAGAAPAKVAA